MSDAMKDAREQACKNVGFLASRIITCGMETFEIPNPSLLPDDADQRYSQLQLDMELDPDLDRYPDVKDADGNTRPGLPKEPLRTKDGKLAEGYNTRLAKAILGPAQFKKFIAAGGRSSDIKLYWTEMNQALADRAKDDSKSVGGDSGLAEVPDSD